MNKGNLKSDKRIAILIPVYNNLELTKKCLKSLTVLFNEKEKSNISYFVIIIDDGSTDSTSSWIQEHYPNCILLHGNGNLWWSGGINMGARYALEKENADYILLWNNDIQTPSDYFSNLSDIVLNLSTPAIIGSVIYSDPDYKTIWSAGGKFNPYSGKKSMLKDISGKNPIEADWLPGMGTLVPNEIIGKIGYWDAIRFPQYHGDSDFTYRAKISGYKIYVYQQLAVLNDLSNSGIKKVTRFSEVFHSLTSIKSIHHIGKNFLFYRLYSKTPWAYIKFIKIYLELFGGIAKRQIRVLLGKCI